MRNALPERARPRKRRLTKDGASARACGFLAAACVPPASTTVWTAIAIFRAGGKRTGASKGKARAPLWVRPTEIQKSARFREIGFHFDRAIFRD